MKAIKILIQLGVFNILWFGYAASAQDLVNKKQITIICDGFPKENHIVYFGDGLSARSSSDLFFLKDNLLENQYIFDDNNTRDTLRIVSSREWVEVTHFYNVVETSNYLLHMGDTVIITYVKNKPKAIVTNRNTKEYDLNFDLQKRGLFMGGVPAIYRYSYPYLYHTPPKDDITALFKKDIRLIDSIKVQYVEEFNIMDSLLNMGLLSENIYVYRRNTLISKVYNMFSNGFIGGTNLSKLLTDTTKYSFKDDSLVFYNYYRSYISAKISNHLSKIKKIVEAGGTIPDYRVEFDTIESLGCLNNSILKYFLLTKLEGMMNTSNYETIVKYVDKYKIRTGDTNAVSELLNEHRINLSQNGNLLLEDLYGKPVNFDEMLLQNKGKVIYVDFWASWCAPCHASMTHALALREYYERKDVVFLYLGYNDNVGPWRNAIKSLGINGNSKNYIITNSKTARMINDLRIKTIPRYLLFNKQGKLVHPNAPGPEGEAIRKELNQLLIE